VDFDLRMRETAKYLETDASTHILWTAQGALTVEVIAMVSGLCRIRNGSTLEPGTQSNK
jgi:hypothetical protein